MDYRTWHTQRIMDKSINGVATMLICYKPFTAQASNCAIQKVEATPTAISNFLMELEQAHPGAEAAPITPDTVGKLGYQVPYEVVQLIKNAFSLQ